MQTPFMIPAEAVAAKRAELEASFKASGRPGSFAETAVAVIARRMQAKPGQYLEFGPYWWAVKAVLADAGHDVGDSGEPVLAARFGDPEPVNVLVAAELFKDHYRATFFEGHNSFDIGDGEDYMLDDPDMQARIALA